MELLGLLVVSKMRVLASHLLLLAASLSAGFGAGLDLDGDRELNRNLDPRVFHHGGQYSGRYLVHSDVKPVAHAPPGCEVTLVNSVRTQT